MESVREILCFLTAELPYIIDHIDRISHAVGRSREFISALGYGVVTAQWARFVWLEQAIAQGLAGMQQIVCYHILSGLLLDIIVDYHLIIIYLIDTPEYDDALLDIVARSDDRLHQFEAIEIVIFDEYAEVIEISACAADSIHNADGERNALHIVADSHHDIIQIRGNVLQEIEKSIRAIIEIMELYEMSAVGGIGGLRHSRGRGEEIALIILHLIIDDMTSEIAAIGVRIVRLGVDESAELIQELGDILPHLVEANHQRCELRRDATGIDHGVDIYEIDGVILRMDLEILDRNRRRVDDINTDIAHAIEAREIASACVAIADYSIAELVFAIVGTRTECYERAILNDILEAI